MDNPAPVLKTDTHVLWDFNIHTDHLISARRPDLIIINNNNKKRRTCKIVDFARELKKLWNMKVTIIPIVIGAFGKVTKGLWKGLDDLEVSRRVATIQTTASLRTARILRRVPETWEDLLSLKILWETISVKNSEGVNNNNNKNNNNNYRPSDSQLKKENLPNCGLFCSCGPQSEIERKGKMDNYSDSARELKNCGTWKLRWHQLLLVFLLQPK